jgi:tetratricopeptide (TPR) repeat protein
MKRLRRELGVGAALAVVTLAIYWPALGHDFVNFDDNVYVYKNAHVHSGLSWDAVGWALTTTHQANWHPLTWLSLQLDASLFGPGPFGFHLTNVGLHVVNTLLLFAFFRAATGRCWPSAVVAGLFALHPLHVESVAWVAERKDILSGLFWMLALLAYVAYVRRPGRARYLAVAGALALGLLAKPMVVTLPCVLLLLDYWPLRRREPPRRLLLEKLPLLAMVGAACAVTLYAQQAGRALKDLTEIGPVARLGNALEAYVIYLRKTVLPTDLAVLYPHSVTPPPLLHVLAAVGVLALISWICWRSYRARPYLAVGWLWYLGTLVPVIGLVQVGEQALADRYTYIPLIGIFVMGVWGLAAVAERLRAPRALVGAGVIAMLAGCAIGTHQQLGHWRDGGTLWEHELAVVGPYVQAHRNLGLHFLEHEQAQKALPHFEEALRVESGRPEAHYDLAAVFDTLGRLEDAERGYAQALRLDPGFWLARVNYGAVLTRQGRLKEAAGNLEAVLRQYPDNALAHLRYGMLLEKRGEAEAAMTHYRKALRAEPGLELAHYNLGTYLGKRGQLAEAVKHLAEAVRLEPRHVQAHENLGHAYEALGQHQQALGCYRAATQIDARNVHARLSLAALLLRLGNASEARAEYGAAVDLDPEWPRRYGRAAWVLATHPDPRKRDQTEAVALAEEACLATDRRQPQLLDTLGAAYAAAGRFEQATAVARRALELASAGNLTTLIPPLQHRLKLYEDRKPFRDSSLR